MLYSENYVQDLIDSDEFQEEAEKGIDVPFYELDTSYNDISLFQNDNILVSSIKLASKRLKV